MKNQKDKVEKLIQYVRGELSAKERQKLKSELETDSELVRLLSLVNALEESQADLNLVDDSRAAQSIADQIFHDFRRTRSKRGNHRGVVVFDSKLLPLPEGIRPAKMDTRRLKYHVGELDLHLSLYPISPDSYEIIGQVAGGPDNIEYEIQLARNAKKLTCRTDPFGLFRFERVPVDSYKLTLTGGSLTKGIIEVTL